MQLNITQVWSICILTSGDDVAHGAEWGDDDDDDDDKIMMMMIKSWW